MPSITATRVNRWLVANERTFAIAGWICFAIVCADYANFIDLPTLVVVPFWAGVVLNIMRWTVGEALLKPRLVGASTGEAPPSD